MKQRYQELSFSLAYQAASAFYNGKWSRYDVLAFTEEYTGYARREIYKDELDCSFITKDKVLENIAAFVLDMVDDVMNGNEPDCIDPVTTELRPDGMTGKMREIANLSIPHQLLGHLVALGLEPLFYAKFLPTQHASIPGRGQTGLVKQTAKYFRSRKYDVRFIQKTDGVHAYASIRYRLVIDILRKLIPSAKWILTVMEYLAKLAPGEHLIIGGYLDAWLFNFVMSFGLRYVLQQGQCRRGKYRPFVRFVEAYMDDCGFGGTTRTGVRKAVSLFSRWMEANMAIRIRTTTGIIRILSIEEEKERRKMQKPSQRGCPYLDMGGFRIFRTHVTIRPRACKRVIRAFVRAQKEIDETGTMRLKRANDVIARYSAIKSSDSETLKAKYNVDAIVRVAKAVVSYWGRERTRKRKKWLMERVNATSLRAMYSY